MRIRLVVLLLVVVGLGVCWAVYTINARNSNVTVGQRYQERQKALDKFIDEQNKPSKK